MFVCLSLKEALVPSKASALLILVIYYISVLINFAAVTNDLQNFNSLQQSLFLLHITCWLWIVGCSSAANISSHSRIQAQETTLPCDVSF